MKDDLLQFLENLICEAQEQTLHNEGRIAAGVETAEFIRSMSVDQPIPGGAPQRAAPPNDRALIAPSSSRKPNGRTRPPAKNLSDEIRDVLVERDESWSSVAAIQMALEKRGVQATQEQITRILTRENREGVVNRSGGLYRLKPLNK